MCIRDRDGALLFLRLFIGGMMLSHGWAKLASFSTLSATFPDPLGVGSTLSLLLILFAEVGCSCLLIFGLMTRLATLPLMFGMLMAFFVIHGADPFAVRELPLLYLGVYVFLLWGGACLLYTSFPYLPDRLEMARQHHDVPWFRHYPKMAYRFQQ